MNKIFSAGHSFVVEWPSAYIGGCGSYGTHYDNLADALDDLTHRAAHGKEPLAVAELLAPGFNVVTEAFQTMVEQRLQEVAETQAHDAGTRRMAKV